MGATLEPGQPCPTCKRKMPTPHEGPPGPKRARFTVAIPPGEEGAIDDLLEQWAERIRQRWPEEVGELSDQGWRYRALHYGLYILSITDDRVLPAASGS